MYKYLFGPVPSRRLGMSLGVDLVIHKTCSLDCVYCECGRTTNLTCERKEYVPVKDVLKELEHYFENSRDPDYITFSGSGEPTLNTGIGKVIDFIKTRKKEVSIALLTNGTLFSKKGVRDDVINSDLIIPSLDAASTHGFRKINRPCSGLNIEEYIQGLCDLRNEFKGQIWLEVLIIPGYNDGQEELELLKKSIKKIKPDKIQLNTLDRPGTIIDLVAVKKDNLKNISEFLGFDNVEIIAAFKDQNKDIPFRKDIREAILETIKRRPCTLEDLSSILGKHVNEINKYLSILENQGKIKVVIQKRGSFYAEVR
ncbi:MAG: radical SAM protein [Desulfobacteraceae bacterium]|nr:radical SAM protein [Desulfobacteraceae bacterium]